MARTSPRELALPRSERLRRAAEFQAVFQKGKREEGHSFVALWAQAGQGRKVGFAVSRRVRGAVNRNRGRRRLQEAYRRQRGELPPGMQVIFVGRPATLTEPFSRLLGEMHHVIGLLAQAARRDPDSRAPQAGKS